MGISKQKIIDINGKLYSEEDLFILIPMGYRYMLFEIRFNDMHEFSQFVMFANCAEEARAYKRTHLVKQNEASLSWFLENRHV